MATKRIPKKRPVHSFQARPQIEAILQDVLDVAGLKLVDLVNDALEDYIPRMMQARSDEQATRTKKILDHFKTGNKTATPPSNTSKGQ